MNNALFLLMGLLALSYLGGALVNRRGSGTAIGLPAGIEYVAVGFVLSPSLLGVVERSVLDLFSPLVQCALAWLTFIIGLEFGQAGGKNIETRVVFAAILGAALTLVLSGGGAFYFLSRFPAFFRLGSDEPAWVLAAGLGVAMCETTRHAVRWVMTKYRTEGPVSEIMHGYAATSDVVPLGALGILFAFTNRGVLHVGSVVIDPVARLGITIVIGCVLGGVALALVGNQVRGHAVWGALFGSALMGVGIANRLGLSDLTVTFFEGLTIAAISKQRRALRTLLAPTERAVMLPTLLLAGTRLDFHVLASHRALAIIVVYALVARAAAKWVSGAMLASASSDLRAAGSIGGGLLSAGALSIAFGLTMAMRFPGTIGDTVLIATAMAVLLGEIVAPRALRGLLERAGELDQARASMTSMPPPSAPPPSAEAHP